VIFLGQASNYSARQVLRQLFAWGTKKDSAALKRKLARKYDAKSEDVYLYHTGRSALAAAFQAVAPAGSGIIIPGLTCIAVVRAVRAAGCVPIFVDIDPQTLQYDWIALDKTLKVCYNASTIVAQNTLGLPLDMEKLEQVAHQYDLKIVEDLAHCAGRFYPDGREIGTVGVAAALSFGKGKAIDTMAGGALVLREKVKVEPVSPTKRPHWSDRWRERWYPVLGAIMRAGYHVGLGKVFTAIFLKLKWIQKSADAELNLDTRLTHWQAKLASRQLDHLPSTPLREHKLISHRDELLKVLKVKGYYLDEIWYDTPVSPARYTAEAKFPESECPNTVKIAAEIINYPSWYSAEQLAPVKYFVEQWQKEQSKKHQPQKEPSCKDQSHQQPLRGEPSHD